MSNTLKTNLSIPWKKNMFLTNLDNDIYLTKITNNLKNFINLEKLFSISTVFVQGHTYIKTNINNIFNLDSEISQFIFNYQYKTIKANENNYNNKSKKFIYNINKFVNSTIPKLLKKIFTKIFISDHLPVIDNNNKIMSWNIEHDIITLQQSSYKQIYTKFSKRFHRFIVLKNYCIINIINKLIKSNYICCIQEGSYLLLWLLYQIFKEECYIKYTARPWHATNQPNKYKGTNTFFNYLRNSSELKKYPYQNIKNIDARCIFILIITIIPKQRADTPKQLADTTKSIPIMAEVNIKTNLRNNTTNLVQGNNTCPNLVKNETLNNISKFRGLQTYISKNNETIIIINMHLKADNDKRKPANSKLTSNDKNYFDTLIKPLITKLTNKTQIHVVGDFNCSGDLIFKHIKTMSNTVNFEGTYTICKELKTAVDGIFTINNNARIPFKKEASIQEISARKKKFAIKYFLKKIITNKDILDLLLNKLKNYLDRNEINKYIVIPILDKFGLL